MSFGKILARHDRARLSGIMAAITPALVRRAWESRNPGPEELAALLSPAAGTVLEEMAQKAHQLTVRQFGQTIQLFTPLYVSNLCTNGCVYCGFNLKNTIPRHKLSLEQVEAEAVSIAATGLKQILMLTGDAPRAAGPEYLVRCIRILKKHFTSAALEVFALGREEYARLINAGVDGLTIFQETYNRELYARLHPFGPKRDFDFRLNAPERAGEEGMRGINIGALLGLDDWRQEAFLTGLHVAWLQARFPAAEISLSLPRIRPQTGGFEPLHPVDEAALVQIMLALRIFLPRCGITISTRESSGLRDHLLPLGVTRMSAGVSTAVGGHAEKDQSTSQFEIADHRTLDQVVQALAGQGYQAVYQDWLPLAGAAPDQNPGPIFKELD